MFDRKWVVLGGLLLAAGLGWGAGAAGQEPATRPTHCMMTATRSSPMAKKTVVTLDFGDSDAFVDLTLRDELTGKATKFNSVVDALNQMSADGWNQQGGYVLGGNTTNPTWVFLLRKD